MAHENKFSLSSRVRTEKLISASGARQNQLRALLLLPLLVACGSLPTKSKNVDELSKIKKIAVVSFKVNTPTSSKMGLELGSGKAESSSGGSMISEQSQETQQMFLDFQKAIARAQKWSVVDLKSMKDHSAYKTAWKSTMEGFQNKMPSSPGTQDFLIEGVMDSDGPRILRPAGRDNLIRELGVDAIAVLTVNIRLKGTSVMGLGNSYPYSSVHVQMYKKGIENPVWFETFNGDASKESLGMTGFFDEKKMIELALASARSAYSKIGVGP